MTVTTWNESVRRRWLGSDAPAVVTEAFTWSGDELLARAGGAARWLDDIGFGPDEVVPAVVDESAAAIALVVGATLSGRAPAPLGTKLPAADLAAALRGIGAHDVICDPARLEVTTAAAEAAGARVHVLHGPPPPSGAVIVDRGPDDVALVVHTSGTTGLPKPVRASQYGCWAKGDVYHLAMPVGPGDLYTSASPFSHTAGVSMTYTALSLGVAQVPTAWFSIEGWVRACRLGVTCALLVPTMIDMLLTEGVLAEAAPRRLQYGAAPIHPDTLEAALKAAPGTSFLQVFGQTEASPLTALGHDDHLRALDGDLWLLGTIGRAIEGVELRLEQPDDEGHGELTVRSHHVFQRDDDGWRRTGDIASIDADGYVRLHGRLNDRIIRGGENIFPIEVEHVLAQHPGVREAAVVGVPDRRWGEVVRAVVVPVDPADPPSVEDLRQFVRDRIAHFKVPAVVDFVDALPRNAAGKVLRRELVE